MSEIEVVDGQERQEQIRSLGTAIFRFLSEHFSGYCLDNDDERATLSSNLAMWLLAVDKTTDYSRKIILPKAKYTTAFNVVDEMTGKHIVTLELSRDRMMTDGDFLQMQNFFWNTIGRAVAENPDVVKTLQAAGIRVVIGSGNEGGQPSPG